MDDLSPQRIAAPKRLARLKDNLGSTLARIGFGPSRNQARQGMKVESEHGDYIGTLRSKYDAHFGSEPSTVFPGHEYWDDSAGVPAIDVFVYRKEDTGRPHDVLITAGMAPAHELPAHL
ncbi:hypothetical protein P4050_28055 [Pseudomonas aeruginosa]|nr:hypothetical protein [Pseudomonas aeruginosa]